jgi:hypothetical protein
VDSHGIHSFVVIFFENLTYLLALVMSSLFKIKVLQCGNLSHLRRKSCIDCLENASIPTRALHHPACAVTSWCTVAPSTLNAHFWRRSPSWLFAQFDYLQAELRANQGVCGGVVSVITACALGFGHQ